MRFRLWWNRVSERVVTFHRLKLQASRLGLNLTETISYVITRYIDDKRQR